MLISANALALDWKVINHNNEYYLKVINSDRRIQIIFNGTPKILSQKDISKNISLINYDSGDYGTSSITKIIRTIIYNKSTNTVILDIPSQYINKNKVTNSNLKVDIKKKEIRYKDLESEEFKVHKY